MIKTIEIQNFKSIEKITLELGRVNIFIGENGAGKSNILEAIALAGAAAARKLDNEFLMSRGIRVSHPRSMRPRFSGFKENEDVEVSVLAEGRKFIRFRMGNDNKAYSSWSHVAEVVGEKSKYSGFDTEIERLKQTPEGEADLYGSFKELVDSLRETVKDIPSSEVAETESFHLRLSAGNVFRKFISMHNDMLAEECGQIKDFVIFSPENSALRVFDREGQIEPLGVNGEGLFKLLNVLSEDFPNTFKEINDSLKVLGWFKGFSVKRDEKDPQSRMEIKDYYLDDDVLLDQRSANEGFLFLVFYFALFSTSLTPDFFAIDNVDVSLNPKLCQKLMSELSRLSSKYGKQAILTTHNPAVLDGLNLEDDDQRLFVVSRSPKGYTKVKRIRKPSGMDLRLSEMFMRGVLGGLPKGF